MPAAGTMLVHELWQTTTCMHLGNSACTRCSSATPTTQSSTSL